MCFHPLRPSDMGNGSKMRRRELCLLTPAQELNIGLTPQLAEPVAALIFLRLPQNFKLGICLALRSSECGIRLTLSSSPRRIGLPLSGVTGGVCLTLRCPNSEEASDGTP
ncbi:hypothetical protein ATKI12_5776 [Kitasatospora sp. Ki12]